MPLPLLLRSFPEALASRPVPTLPVSRGSPGPLAEGTSIQHARPTASSPPPQVNPAVPLTPAPPSTQAQLILCRSVCLCGLAFSGPLARVSPWFCGSGWTRPRFPDSSGRPVLRPPRFLAGGGGWRVRSRPLSCVHSSSTSVCCAGDELEGGQGRPALETGVLRLLQGESAGQGAGTASSSEPRHRPASQNTQLFVSRRGVG